MSHYIVHSSSGSLKHAAPYSTPNSGKRLLAKWTVKNLRVFQETPGNAYSGIFASFDLVNANDLKEKAHNMQFSFADGTSANKNIIARIRRFFNDAYNRQRGYGFPELTEMEKQQIVARINTAYNQWSGFSHSADSFEHKATAYLDGYSQSETERLAKNLKPDSGQWIASDRKTGKFTIEYYTKGLLDKDKWETHLYIMPNQGRQSSGIIFTTSGNKPSSYTPELVTSKIKLICQGFCKLTDEECSIIGNRASGLIKKNFAQHPGYYSPNLQHASDEPDVIDCTSDQDDYLEHHGVKGQKWGVINEKPTDPRQRTRSSSSSGHPYYSPNTGNSSRVTNSVVKRDTNPGKNTSTSTNKTYYTADLSQKPLSDKDGVHYVIGMGNSGYGAQITVPSNVITSTLDRDEDVAAMVKNQVIQGINGFRNNPRYGEPYKHLHLTDKQIDSIVWSLVYKIEKDWKKNYYKPGQY